MNDGSVSEDFDQLFGAYFHEDWDLEADDWQGIVDHYVSDGPTAERLLTLAQEIEVLREALTEPELEHLMSRTIGARHNRRPLSFTEWLGQVADRLRPHAEGPIAAHRKDPVQLADRVGQLGLLYPLLTVAGSKHRQHPIQRT